MTNLTGRVELDKESMKALKSEIREEIINDMAENGLLHEEVIKYLKTSDSSTFFNLVHGTIDKSISIGNEKEEKNEFHFDDGTKLKLLKTFREIMALAGFH